MLVGLVARIPARVQTKLLVAFLAIAVLLIVVGAVGLQGLSGVNDRTEELIKLQRKIEAYRQVQHDTTSQLYSVASALLSSDERTLDSTLRQLNQFGYDVDRLEFVAKDEVELLAQFRQDYDRFIDVVTRVVELIRAGRADEARRDAVARGHAAGRPARAADQPAGQQGRGGHGRRVSRPARNAYATSRCDRHRLRARQHRARAGARLCDLLVADRPGEARSRHTARPDRSWRLHTTRRGRQSRRAGRAGGQRQPKMREELGRLYQQLEAASRNKSQFLASMSHELRTPLNAIIGLTEMMVTNAARFGTEKAQEPLQRVNRAGTHLLGLINQVLDLSKIEAGKLELNPQTVQLAPLIEEVIGTARQLAEQNKNRLIRRRPGGPRRSDR